MAFARVLAPVLVFFHFGFALGEDASTCSSEGCMSDDTPETTVSLMQTNLHIASQRKGPKSIESAEIEKAGKRIKEMKLKDEEIDKRNKSASLSNKTKAPHGAVLVAKKAGGKSSGVCATYKRLYCAEGNTWTSSKTSKFATLQLCQASCTAIGKGYANYYPAGACLCCDTGDYYSNGYASLAGATDCTDPAATASSSTTTVADVDAFVVSWATTYGLSSYSVMAGDAEGVRYVYQQSSGNPDLYEADKVDKAIYSYSVGKWVAAASLGRACKLGVAHWDDPVNKYISFWPTASSDGRSAITFRHLMSHTSGLSGDTTIQTSLGMQDAVMHADLELMNSTIILSDQVKLILDATPSSITVPADFMYGESHYLVMQYAIMQAAGYSKWRDFFYDYWGAHLGMEKAKIIKYGGFTEAENFFWEGHDQTVAYGFYEENREGAADVLNPDSGSQLIISPCGYSRFLMEYARQGDAFCAAGNLDDTYAQTHIWTQYFGNYALGHWVYDDGIYNIWHSAGYAGATPIMSSLANHEKFWVYLNLYDAYGGVWTSITFIHDGVAIVRQLFEGPNKPAVTTDYCSTVAPTGYCEYNAQWTPATLDSVTGLAA